MGDDVMTRWYDMATGALAATTLVWTTQVAEAAPTTYEFSGTVSSAGLFTGSENPDWSFEAGNPFHGTLVYDPAQVAFSYDYINQPDFKLTYYQTPLVSLTYEIDTTNGLFSYSPPTGASGASVGLSDGSGVWWTGVDFRWQNYPFAGQPQYAVPSTGYVGAYYAHASFLSLMDYLSQPLTSTDPDVDLVKLYDAIPEYSRRFDVRFSDPANWEPGIEHIDGIVYGQITSFAKVGAAVPEPSAWAMLIGGFAVLGAGLRRPKPRPRIAC